MAVDVITILLDDLRASPQDLGVRARLAEYFVTSHRHRAALLELQGSLRRGGARRARPTVVAARVVPGPGVLGSARPAIEP